MLTECLAETDHKDEAAALFEEYINNHDDKDITALSYLGDIYSEMEDYEKALQYLYKAESLGRNDVWININTGYALIKTNNLEKAAEYDDKAELVMKNLVNMMKHLIIIKKHYLLKICQKSESIFPL